MEIPSEIFLNLNTGSAQIVEWVFLRDEEMSDSVAIL